MKDHFKHIEDFLTDESFKNWVINPTPELDTFWMKWLKENKDQESVFNQAKIMILSFEFQEYSASEQTKRRILNRINEQSQPASKLLYLKNNFVKVAAVFIFIISVGFLYQLLISDQNKELLSEENVILRENTAGVKSEHLLSDGSRIYLNSNSTIEYPKVFDTEQRIVRLEGEAFFQVSHDAERPFIVETKEFDVEVLGTSFNVLTKPDMQEVALVVGKVRLTSLATNNSTELNQGELALFNSDDDSFITSSFDARIKTGWKDGYLVFQDASFEEVINSLYAWYGLDISVINKPDVSDWSYTASFRNESLETVLTNMVTLRRFEYSIKNDSLIITF